MNLKLKSIMLHFLTILNYNTFKVYILFIYLCISLFLKYRIFDITIHFIINVNFNKYKFMVLISTYSFNKYL